MVRPKPQKKDKRFVPWNVRNLYRAGSLTATARKLAIYKSDVVGLQYEVGQGGLGMIISYMEKETKIINWKQDVLYITE